MFNTGWATKIVEWKNLNWAKIQKRVFKLQKRIYQAEISGNIKRLRRLQKTLLRSWSAKLLATRQVTQDNTGNRTAGIDGIKSIMPIERIVLAKNLNLKSKPLPARRIYIPKPGKDEKRPLSILTEEEGEIYLNSFKPKRSKRKKTRRTYDKGCNREEPCEAKVSSTVLQTSGSRKGVA